jgi:hypothetical protein
MKTAGVTDAAGNTVDTKLEWLGERGILESDLLYSNPLRNMQEIYGKDEAAMLGFRIVDFIKHFSGNA